MKSIRALKTICTRYANSLEIFFPSVNYYSVAYRLQVAQESGITRRHVIRAENVRKLNTDMTAGRYTCSFLFK